MKVKLKAKTPNTSHRPYSLDMSELIIGRSDVSKKVDIDLSPDRRVSRQHVRLTYHDSVWWAQDLDSKYGTQCSRGGNNGTSTLEQIPITGRLEIYPGDCLLLGDSEVVIDYETTAIDTPEIRDLANTLPPEQIVKADDESKPDGMSETNFMDIGVRFADIMLYENGDSMLRHCVKEIHDDFRSRISDVTILLRQETELLPHAVYPPGARSATFSYTLARRAIDNNEAFSWPDPNIETTSNITRISGSAIYAPIVTLGDVAGVVHIATRDVGGYFNRKDVERLAVIAKLLGPSIERDWQAARFDPSRFPQVFVSYATPDREFVQRFANDLRRRFIRVWYDERLETGDFWKAKVSDAITKHTDVFLLLVSPDSVKSPNVQWEINKALERKIPILPVEYKKAPAPDLISELQYRPIGEVFGDAVYENGVRALIADIKTNIKKGSVNE